MAPIKLNGNRQLLIDDGVIDEVNGLAQVLNQPTPYAGNPILRPSPPWEHDVGFLGTVVRDDNGTFRAWYQGWFDESYPASYATSEDGIHWQHCDRQATDTRSRYIPFPLLHIELH